jgi:hypothetical protein
MSGKPTANPWSVLDQVGERVQRGFGTAKFEVIDVLKPQSPISPARCPC